MNDGDRILMKPARTTPLHPDSSIRSASPTEKAFRSEKSSHLTTAVGIAASAARLRARADGLSETTKEMLGVMSGVSISLWRLVPDPDANTAMSILPSGLRARSSVGAPEVWKSSDPV